MGTIVMLKEKIQQEPQHAVTIKEGPAVKKKPERSILCSLCDHRITRPSAEISVNGKPRHTFSNPNGFIFEIRCFSKAPGCINEGVPTEEYTWFPGHAWCYSLCAQCLAHLGWFFSSGTGEFFGLIIDRLKETNGNME
jgi:hypothetical protein